MKRLFIAGSCGIFLLATSAVVEAQTTTDFTRCTTANVMGGVSFADSDQTPVLGGAFGWELTARLNIEVTARWLMEGDGADAFAFMFTAQRPLLPRRTFVPFVSGGMGVYSASYPSGSATRYTDPAFVFGGGVSLFASRNISVRPEFEAMWVISDVKSRFVTSATVRFAYHFEEHRITAAVRPR